jgi:hypothetical protein
MIAKWKEINGTFSNVDIIGNSETFVLIKRRIKIESKGRGKIYVKKKENKDTIYRG